MTKTVLLGDVIDIDPPAQLRKGEDVPFLSMDKVAPFTKSISTGEIKPYSGGAKFQNGDTLLARITPCLENGKTAYVDFLGNNRTGAGSTEFIVLRAKHGITESGFTYYLAISPEFRDYAIKSMIGTSGRQRVQSSQLKQYKFELPSLDRQQEISKILGDLDAKIELNRRVNETLEKIGQALFKHYFIDNPDRKKWKVVPLSVFGSIICGKTPPKGRREFFGGSIPFIKIPDMHNQIFVTATQDTLTQSGHDYQIGKTLPPEAICTSCIATVGLVTLTSRQSQTNQQINSIILSRKEYTYYLYFLLKSMRAQLIDMASGGSATPNLNTSSFSNIPTNLPDNELLRNFDTKVRPIFQQVLINQLQKENLVNLRDSLLPRLISGAVRA